MKLIWTLSLLLAGINVFAQASDKSRLIATATLKYDQLNTWLLFDSASYRYPSGNGRQDKKYAELTQLEWKPDTLVFYKFDIPTQKYEPFTRRILLFDTQHLVIEKSLQTYTASMWVNSARNLYTYSNTDLIATVNQNFSGNQWMNQSRNTHAYNTSHELVTTVNEYWDAGLNQWAPSTLVQNTYNTAAQLTEIIGRQYINNQWQDISKDTYNYTSGNQLDTLINHNWNTTSLQWSPIARYILTYTGKLRDGDFYESYNSISATWEQLNKRSYTYDADTNIATQVLANWVNGAYENTVKHNYTYNNHHQQLTSKSQSWDAAQLQFIDTTGNAITNYYYELYPGSISNPTPVETAEVLLYPNPARNELNLQISFGKMQAYSIAVYDLTGKMLKQYNTTHAKECHKTFNTAGMPAGNYILKLTTGAEEITKCFSVVK